MSDTFIGLSELLEKHYQQLKEFKEWAAKGEWSEFHRSHYDWWAYPIDEESGFGNKYKLGPEEISTLKEDTAFINSLREAVNLYLLSSGWDVVSSSYRPDLVTKQRYNDHPIRLWKVWRSSFIFELSDLEVEVLKFARELKSLGYTFVYAKKDRWPELHGQILKVL